MRKTTGERLKELMEILEITQADLCRDLNLSKSTVSQYVNDKREPKQNILTLIAERYSVSETWLMGYPTPMKEDLFSEENAELDLKISNDVLLKEYIKKYYDMTEEQKKQVRDFIDFISAK